MATQIRPVTLRPRRSSRYSQQLRRQLVAYWRMDEPSGYLQDVYGSNDLGESGGTIGAAAGRIRGGRDFEASDTAWFSRADSAGLSTGDIDFTWQVWTKAESFVNFPILFHKGIDGSNVEYTLYYHTGSTTLRFGVASGALGANYTEAEATNAGALSENTWYCIHCWHDAAANQTGIAVNAGTPNTSSYSAGVWDGTGDFNLGASPAQSLYWDGIIDEVGFWKRVLTSHERVALYNNGRGLAYPFLPSRRRMVFVPTTIGGAANRRRRVLMSA